MDLTTLTALLGWSLLINLAYLTLAALTIVVFGEQVANLHRGLLKIDAQQMRHKYVDFLSLYKVLTLALMAAPYLALKIMGY